MFVAEPDQEKAREIAVGHLPSDPDKVPKRIPASVMTGFFQLRPGAVITGRVVERAQSRL